MHDRSSVKVAHFTLNLLSCAARRIARGRLADVSGMCCAKRKRWAQSAAHWTSPHPFPELQHGIRLLKFIPGSMRHLTAMMQVYTRTGHAADRDVARANGSMAELSNAARELGYYCGWIKISSIRHARPFPLLQYGNPDQTRQKHLSVDRFKVVPRSYLSI
jgi:hypothetical protein